MKRLILLFLLMLPLSLACEQLESHYDHTLAGTFNPYVQLHPDEKYEIVQVHYQVFNVSDTRVIQYWFEWDYSKAAWYENLFGKLWWGKKFNHEFDLEPVFVTVKDGEILKVEYDAKHYARGTITEPLLVEGKHPVLKVIKNSHGFLPPDETSKITSAEPLTTLTTGDRNRFINKLYNIVFPLNISAIMHNPTCFSEIESGMWSFINRRYGDKSGKIFYEPSIQ